MSRGPGPTFAILASVLALVCPGSVPADAEDAGPVVDSVRLDEVEPFLWELRLLSSGDLDLLGIRGGDDGLEIQLPRHDLGSEVRDSAFADGPVAAIRFRVDETARGPSTRVLVDVRQPLAYSLETEGPVARIRLWPRDQEPPEAVLRRRVEELRTELRVVETSRDELSQRLVELTADQRRLRESFDVAEARREALQPRLEAALGEAGSALRELSARLRDTESRLHTAGAREDELRAEVAALEERFAVARREATAALEDQRTRIDRLERQNASLLEELARRDRQLLELRTGTPSPPPGAGGTASVDALERVEIPPLPVGDRPRPGASEPAPPPAVRAQQVGPVSGDRAPEPGNPGDARASREDSEAAPAISPNASSTDATSGGETSGSGGETAATVPGLEVTEVEEPVGESDGESYAVRTPRLHLVVAATELEPERAERKASEVRARGYTGEIHRSVGGYLLVLLDRLPYPEAVRLRDEAVARGDAPADTYLIPVGGD